MERAMRAQEDSDTSGPPLDFHEPYGGYHRRDIPPEDAELTHVGPGTPCGEYMRKFWQPICLSQQLTHVPLAIRILGEDLVAFRDRSDRQVSSLRFTTFRPVWHHETCMTVTSARPPTHLAGQSDRRPAQLQH